MLYPLSNALTDIPCDPAISSAKSIKMHPPIPFTSIRDMPTFSESSYFGSLFRSALDEYQNQTGINLLRHPLAVQLDRCNSVETINEVLEQQAWAFREFRGGNNKVMTLLKHAVHFLHKLSAAVVLGEHLGLVRPRTS